MQPTFTVGKRTHTVFLILYHSPLLRDNVGASWQSFLHAMVAPGFSAQMLHGLISQFTFRDLVIEQFDLHAGLYGSPCSQHRVAISTKCKFLWRWD